MGTSSTPSPREGTEEPVLQLPPATEAGQPPQGIPQPSQNHAHGMGHRDGTVHLFPCAITTITVGRTDHLLPCAIATMAGQTTCSHVPLPPSLQAGPTAYSLVPLPPRQHRPPAPLCHHQHGRTDHLLPCASTTMAGLTTCSLVPSPPPPQAGCHGRAGALCGEVGTTEGDGASTPGRTPRARAVAGGHSRRPRPRRPRWRGTMCRGHGGAAGRGAAGPVRVAGAGRWSLAAGPPLPSPVGRSPGGAAPRQGAGSTWGAGLACPPSPGRASAARRLRPQQPPPPPPWPPLSPAALWEADLTRCCRRPAGSGTRRHGGRDRR